jgi:hypothetical protein
MSLVWPRPSICLEMNFRLQYNENELSMRSRTSFHHKGSPGRRRSKMVKQNGSLAVCPQPRRTRKLAKWAFFFAIASGAFFWYLNREREIKWLPLGDSYLKSDDFNWSQVSQWLPPRFTI